jgi:hypothetical protein
MKTQSNPWNHLSEAARRRVVRAPLPEAAPYGFHNRVLARVRERQGIPMELWLRMALRALPIAAVVLVACWAVVPVSEKEPDLVDAVIQEVLP